MVRQDENIRNVFEEDPFGRFNHSVGHSWRGAEGEGNSADLFYLSRFRVL